jgi:hypothetical protein
MKRTREQRLALAARKKKVFRAQMGYRTSNAVVMSTGGVAGSGVVRVPKSMPNPAEVKWIEGGFASPGAGTSGAWTLLNNNLVPSIIQGVTSNTRIGKNIRIVGCVYRMSVAYSDAAGQAPAYTVDMVWDKKPLNSTATIQDIYDSAAAGGSVLSTILPNPNQETRFAWQKRIEKSPQNFHSNVCGSFKCNRFVSFSGNDGTISTVEQNNFLVVFGHNAQVTAAENRAALGGRIRLLFIDA